MPGEAAGLRVVITARDEAGAIFKRTSGSLEKLGVDAKKAAEMTRSAWEKGFEAKNLQNAERQLQRLGLTSQQAKATLQGAGVAMADAGKGAAKLASDTQKGASGLSRVASGISGFGDKLMMGTAIVAAPFLLGAGAAVKLGMAAVETKNLYTVSMGDMAAAGDAWIAGMNSGLRLNTTELQRNLGTWQTMLTSMGLSKQSALQVGEGLTSLGYDLASFYNLSTTDAFNKLKSGIMGETEPLRALGIVVSDTTIKNYALTNGLVSQGQEMSEAQKVLVRYAVIMDATSKAQGDLARTIESPTNQLRIMQQQFTELATSIGTDFLPVISQALIWVNDEGLPRVRGGVVKLKDSWIEMSDTGKARIIAVAALFIAGGPLLKGIAFGIQGVALLAKAFALLSTVALGKVGLIAAGIGILVGAIYTFRNEIANALVDVGVGLRDIGDTMQRAGKAGGFPQLAAWGSALKMLGPEMIGMGNAARHNMPAIEDFAASVGKLVDESLGGGFDALIAGAGGLGKGALDDALAAFDKWAHVAPPIKAPFQDTQTEAAQAALKPLDLVKQAWNDAAGAANKAGAAAKDAGLSASKFVAALVAASPATLAAAAAVKLWEGRVSDVNLAIKANQDQLKAAQAELQGMQDHLSDLQAELTGAQKRLEEFSRPHLTGMGQADMQIGAVEAQIKRAKLAESLGVPLSQIIAQYPLLTAGAEGYLSTLPTTEQALSKVLEQLQMMQSLKFDEKMRLLADAAAGSRKEMDFSTAMAGTLAQKAAVDNLTVSIAAQEAAIKSQEGVVKSIQQAGEALNLTLTAYQEQLKQAQTNQQSVTQGLTDAYGWLLTDRAEVEKMGPAGVAAAAQVDEQTRALFKEFDKFAKDTTGSMSGSITGATAIYKQAVNDILAELAKIPRDITTTVHVNYAGGGGGGGVTGLAGGGIVTRPTLALIGERGPEAVVPLGGRVTSGANIDYDRLAAAMARQSLTVEMDGEAVARIVRRRSLQTSARNGYLGAGG